MIVTHEVSTAAPPRPIRLPAAARQHGTRLLNQQFWLWGQDIRHQEGNLLLRYGFERARPPDAVQGSRCYTLRLDPQWTVVLWGFGLFYGDQTQGGLYLSRFRFSPLLGTSAEAPVGIWTPAQLPPFTEPAEANDWARARPLLVAALRWISAYESWIVAEMGSAYRHECLAGRPRATCPARDSPALWLRLSHRCDATLRRAIGLPGSSDCQRRYPQDFHLGEGLT